MVSISTLHKLNISIVYKITLGIFLILFSLTSCETDEQEVKNVNSKKLGVEEGKNIDVIYTIGGKAKAKLSSPLMYRVKDTSSYVEFPKKIHVDFFTDTGKIESTLDAFYAKYFENESKVFLKDSVRFIGLANGDTLYSSELYWDMHRPIYQFYTDKKVQIRTKTHIIDGVGLETNQDFTDKIIKNITNSYIKVPAAEFPAN
jgi:LPS export ABC transporter protein LptC